LLTILFRTTAEKEQLALEHRKALDAQQAITAALKDQLMEAELRHARELKEAQAAAEAKLDETLQEYSNATTVLGTELEEETLARKAAQDRITTLNTDQVEYDRLVMQAEPSVSRSPFLFRLQACVWYRYVLTPVTFSFFFFPSRNFPGFAAACGEEGSGAQG
jgi:high-affinity K+ transport system ATPase subunit B